MELSGTDRKRTIFRGTAFLFVVAVFTLGFTSEFHHTRAQNSSARADGSAASLPGRSSLPQGEGIVLGFTMADFTGDTHPDIATVTLNRFNSANAQYNIEIRLTEGGYQSLNLAAPAGGLLVMPKDVTGDGNFDLIVRAAKSRETVAVYLNDGHGHFSPAKPGAFAGLHRDSDSEDRLAPRRIYFGVTPISPKSSTIHCQNASVRAPRVQRDSPLSAKSGIPSLHLIRFRSNRAPPEVA